MIENFLTVLNNWNSGKNERQKLQHALLALTVVIVLIAGMISLVSADIGHNVVRLALFTLAAFVANGFIWNLLQSLVLSKLSNKPRRK
jgi:cell division protein FtsW (lipid II flippase)